MNASTREKLLTAARKLMEEPNGAEAVTMRRVAILVGITPMAIYKHFPDRDALLRAATTAEYETIAKYFKRANARTQIKGLRGMLGYLDYACDHPQLFRYIFSVRREDAFTYPTDLTRGKSPTLNVLNEVVTNLMQAGVLAQDDVSETSLTIWAQAHGLVSLYLSERIKMPRKAFRDLYMRCLNRLWVGLQKCPRDA